jgi:immunity protein 5 of polymorphic toxin system
MKDSEVKWLKALDPCGEGFRWAKDQKSLADAWEKCERPEWLFWILDRKAPLSHGISIRIAVACAEKSLANFEKQFPDDKRPRLAIEAAKAFAENPTEENRSAAESAARAAAWSAA